MRRDSLIALLGDFVGLHNSPAYKPPRPPTPESEKIRKQQKKERAVSMYCDGTDLPPTSADLSRKPQSSSRRQSEPAVKPASQQHESRKTSTTSQHSDSTIASNPTSESSVGSGSRKGSRRSRRNSETLLGSIAIFSKPLVVINGRM